MPAVATATAPQTIPQKRLSEVCANLVDTQRRRSIMIGSKNMLANRLRAIVAGTIGYSTELTEKERRGKFTEAGKLISQWSKEGGTSGSGIERIAKVTLIGIQAFEEEINAYDKLLLKLSAELPVAEWAELPEQRGFGMLTLGKIIGETGNLTPDACNPEAYPGYANPSKLWRRLGCAPYTSNGKTLMGSTWKKEKVGKLTAEAWTDFGYSPRRRSMIYLVGEGLVKGNQTGPYRTLYNEAKAKALATRPDWTTCIGCGGAGTTAGQVGKSGKPKKDKACDRCDGSGKVAMRCHLHAMLLASKLLLKNLWLEWHGHPPHPERAWMRA